MHFWLLSDALISFFQRGVNVSMLEHAVKQIFFSWQTAFSQALQNNADPSVEKSCIPNSRQGRVVQFLTQDVQT